MKKYVVTIIVIGCILAGGLGMVAFQNVHQWHLAYKAIVEYNKKVQEQQKATSTAVTPK